MAYFSPEEAFETLKDRTAKTIEDYFPVEGKKNVLVAKRVWTEDDKSVDDIHGQLDARLKGRTWSVPVKAELELRDKETGKVKDRKTVTVAQLPKITRRYSYIVDGNEWQLSNQFRLKSGVYTRIKNNGDLASQWNLEKGMGFSMNFNPNSRKMTLGYGTANVGLYPVLKTLGISDDDIEKTWGKEVLSANKGVSADKELRKLYKSMTGKVAASLDEAKNHIAETFDQTSLRADSTKLTLGEPFSKVDGGSLLAGANRLLSVSRQEAEPDDRDSLQFKDFYSAEDLVEERLKKDARWDINRRMKNNIDKRDNVASIVTQDVFQKPLKKLFTHSTISERPDSRNPVAFTVGARKTTIMGKHGIDDDRKITLSAQTINPSHVGFIDPIHTPAGSKKIGAVIQLSSDARKVGKDLQIPVYDAKTGKKVWISPGQALHSNLAFADQFKLVGGKMKPTKSRVKVSNGVGEIESIDPKGVDYVLNSTKGMFDLGPNMIPFLSSDQGNRTMVAAGQLEQAVPLVGREAPLVQTKGEGKLTFEEALGHFNSHHSPVAGSVERVSKDAVIVRGVDGKKHTVQTYDDFPLNDNMSLITSNARVKKGDPVKKGEVLADTSFTDNGVLALGKNLSVAYMPWHGFNFEDAVVISETASKKLTSAHMHRNSTRMDKNVILNKGKFLAETAGQYTKEQAEKLDEDGVIKPGLVVNPGDVIIGEMRKEELTPEQKQLSLFSKKAAKPVRVRATTWDKDYFGKVSRVVKHGKDVTVYVKTETPAEVGDKIVGRHGNKGIISLILPDREMPKTKDESPLEVLLNPAGVVSRINLGQVLETAAAKIALKEGKPYKVNNFDPNNKDYTRNLIKELNSKGISDTEEVFDPQTGKSFGKVMTGPQYILKLHHTAEKGLVARSKGPYTSNLTPQGGGASGGQTMDTMGLYALLAHGARENVREAQTIRSSMNDEVWNKIQTGESIPAPEVPFVYKKFEAMLRGAGVDVKKKGADLVLGPLTDKGVLNLSNGELKNPGRVLRAKDAAPEPGGLFDPDVTGTKWPKGRLGDKFSHITLAQRMPNPTFERPISALLGISEKEYNSVVSGSTEFNGKIGPSAVVDALTRVNVDDALKEAEGSIQNLRGPLLDKSNKKIRYLRALKEGKMSPSEAYTMKYVSVIPPNMRPISVMPNGDINVADVNGIYSVGVGVTNEQLKTFPKELPDEERLPLENSLYDSLKSLHLTGMKFKDRYRSGLIEQITGGAKGSPKEGFFQKKIIGRRQDMSMRGTIVPDPNLSLDEVALPRKAAAEIYKPFTVARITRMTGMPPLEAQKQIREDTPLARKALELETQERPVLMKRDPVLHKYGVQAFTPQLISGKVIKIHPLVTGGLGADFDGDKMSVSGHLAIIDTRNNTKTASGKSSEHNETVFTGNLVSNRVLDIKNFPRLQETKEVDEQGSVTYGVPDGIMVPAFHNGRFKPMPVSEFHIHPNCEEWVVGTKNGRRLECSQSHSLLLLDPNTLECAKSRPSSALGRCVPILREAGEGAIQTLPGELIDSARVREMLEEVPLNRNSGWFLGASIGWVPKVKGLPHTRTAHLSHSHRDSEIALRWLGTAKWLTNGSGGGCQFDGTHDFDGHNCTSFKATVSSSALGVWLDNLMGKGARGKHLPEQFMHMSLEFRRGLFEGLMDTDGTCNWNRRGQFSLSYSTVSERLSEEVMLLGLTLGIPGSVTASRTPAGKPSWVTHFSIRPVQDATWLTFTKSEKNNALKELHGGDLTEFGRNDFVPLPDQARDELLQVLRDLGATKKPPRRNGDAFTKYSAVRMGKTLTRETTFELKTLLGGVTLSEYLVKWFDLAVDVSVGWDLVTSSEPTGKLVEMYDLTVPDAWTFTMANGMAVWDSAYVPISQKAVIEARRMAPSYNLLSPSTGEIMYKPGHEATMGLFNLTKMGRSRNLSFRTASDAARAVKDGIIGMNDLVSIDTPEGLEPELNKLAFKRALKTTVGRLLVYNAVPEGVRDESMLTDKDATLTAKKGKELLDKIARTSRSDYARSADYLKDLGNNYSTGMSFSLEDFTTNNSARDRVLATAEKEELKIRKNPRLSREEKDKKLVDLYTIAGKVISDSAEKTIEKGNNRMYDWVKSGARGNWGQFRQMAVAPMLVVDSRGRTVPVPITKSYSEGLDAAGYWNSMHGARTGTIAKVLETEKPGATFKQMVNTSMNQIVSSDDCGTTKGLSLDPEDPNILDRFLAKGVDLGSRGGKEKGVLPSGTLITPEIQSRLRNNKVKDILVRSPLKCIHGDGICAKCLGLNEVGRPFEKGTNAGVISAQALGEPTTQLSMKKFHTGGVAESSGAQALQGFARLEQLTMLPQTVPNSATLSEESGKVEKIDKDPAGGWGVTIKGKRHFIPGQRAVLVKKGSEVKKGDSLSSGVKNPHQMLPLTGIGSVQRYLTEEMDKVYDKRSPLHRRNIEVFVRSMTNLSVVNDPGSDPDTLKGDMRPTSEIAAFNSDLGSGGKPIRYTPVLKGSNIIPLEQSTDWLARMQATRLKDTVLEGVAQGWRSNIHGPHPIPSMALGASFGEGAEDKPWLY